MNCYYQGCENKGITKEHIPPRSFFPKDEKNQLLTVKSCADHNNAKATDDLYVLAHICMNASPSNRAREIFLKKVQPQLKFNDGAFAQTLTKDSVQLADGSVKYPVEMTRFDEFFTALSCGLVFKSQGAQLPPNYTLRHIYANFQNDEETPTTQLENEIDKFYSGQPLDFIEFGKPDLQNERIYTVKIFGVSEFKSSITIVHLFFGTFKVISMLTNKVETSAANNRMQPDAAKLRR